MNKMFFTMLMFIILNVNIPAIQAETVVSGSEPGKSYVIKVKANSPGSSDKYLFFSKRDGRGWENLDSVLVKEGSEAVFKGSIEAPEIMYLRLENTGKPVAFFAENSDIHILADFENPVNSEVKGSESHDQYVDYTKMMAELDEQKQDLYKAYNEARKENDSLKVQAIVDDFDKLEQKSLNRSKKWVKEHADSWVSPYIIRMNYHSLSLEEMKNMVGALDPKLDKSGYTKTLKDHIATLERVAIGQPYTDFELPTPGDETLSLSDLVGENYLLIDFWASWCGPCRRENPNVVALYNDFHAKGFDILGVSLDNSEENWKKAINDDGLVWHHVSDLEGWNSAAGKLYGVNSIPHTVLLDKDGVIIARNLRGEELRKKLEELID